MTGRGLLALLVEVLEEMQRIVPDDKAEWDAHQLTRLATERLWITAGNVAEAYRRDVLGTEVGTEPWSERIAYRHKLAHALPGDLSSDRIHADTVADLPRLLEQVRHQHQP